MNLRPYQTRALDSIEEAFKACSSALAVAPTGTGKTVLFAHAIKRLVPAGRRAMVLAHREELIHQAADKIYSITGEHPAVEMASSRADESIFKRATVVVASVQTLITGRVNRFDPSEFELLITDEAHHAPAASYKMVYEHMLSAGCKHLGVTATPDRSDEEALGKVFEAAPFVYELPDAINDGWLTPIHQKMVHVTGLDYSQAKTTAGDLNQSDIARAQSSERTLQEMCHPIVDIAGDRKTIIFATPGSNKGEGEDYHIADRMTEIMNRHRNDSTRRVSQDTPKEERRKILADYKAGKFQFLLNVGVFTEGFDEPGIELVAITRPTKSRSLYAQMVGRGTRPLPGLVDQWEQAGDRRAAIASSAKPHLEVLDFVGNSGKHKLITTADILGGNFDDEVVDRARKKAENGESLDMSDALQEAVKEVHAEREAERLRRLKVTATTTYKVQRIDPFDVFDLQPERERGWNKGRTATPKQLALLQSYGVDTWPDMPIGRAGQLIDECIRRGKEGKANYRQAKELAQKGLPTDISVAAASVALGQGDRIANLNEAWKRRMAVRS